MGCTGEGVGVSAAGNGCALLVAVGLDADTTLVVVTGACAGFLGTGACTGFVDAGACAEFATGFC